MRGSEAAFSVRNIYRLTCVFGVAGGGCYLYAAGVRAAFAFVLGSLASLANLWLFDRLSSSIAPGVASRKPWQTGAYVTRYILLLGIGYAIVKALGVSPLTVILGLLTSAAAVLSSLTFELISQVFGGRTSH